MEKVHEKLSTFSMFLGARYATNVVLRQGSQPNGILHERNIFLRGKHLMYGIETKISVFGIVEWSRTNLRI